MFCRNCGKQLPEGTKFCSGCGSQVGGASPAAPQPQTQPAAPQKQTTSRWSGLGFWLLRMVIVAIGMALAAVLISALSTPKVETVTDDGIISAAYSTLFSQNGFAAPETAFSGQDAVAYAKDLGDGMIENMEFSYADGIITGMCDSIYVPVAGLDAATRELLDQQMIDVFSTYETLSFCTVWYDKSDTCYTYTVKARYLDESHNLRMAVQLGLLAIDGDSVELLSIKGTEESLLGSGWIKR